MNLTWAMLVSVVNMLMSFRVNIIMYLLSFNYKYLNHLNGLGPLTYRPNQCSFSNYLCQTFLITLFYIYHKGGFFIIIENTLAMSTYEIFNENKSNFAIYEPLRNAKQNIV